MIRVVVAVAEKEAVVVGVAALVQVVDERRAGRAFGVEPVELVAERVPLFEDAIGQPPEDARIALVLDAKAPDGHAVDRLDAGRQLVPPRDVVGGARGQHLDLGVTGEVFGDVAGVQLGAAVDRLAVALNDDRELHCASGSEPPDPKSEATTVARSEATAGRPIAPSVSTAGAWSAGGGSRRPPVAVPAPS